MLDSKINLDNLIQAIQKDEFEQISKIQSCALLIQDKTPEIKTILTICESYFARYYLYSFINDDGKTDIINYQFRIRNKDGKSIYKKQFKLTERVKSAELKTKEGNFLLPINDLKIEINGNLDHINYLKLNGDFYYLRKVEIPTVLHGSNDWLFLINDRNDSLAQFLGIRSINSDQLNLWKDFFIKAERLSGCKILIAPNKETVFSKYYPYSGCKNKIISQLKGLEESKNFIVDPTAALQRNEKTYSKTDTHWTYYGAAIALKEIFPDIDLNIFQFNEGNRVGDIGSKLIPNVSSPFLYFNDNAKQYKKIFDNGLNQDGHISIYYNEKSSNKKKVILFGDSFSRFFYPLLSSIFEYVICVRSAGSVIEEIVNYEKPDFIIIERAERFSCSAPSFLKLINDCVQITKTLKEIKRNSLTLKKELESLNINNPIRKFYEDQLND